MTTKDVLTVDMIFLLQIRGHNKAQLDPLGILQADLSDSIPADLSLSHWGLGELYKVWTLLEDIFRAGRRALGMGLYNLTQMN